MPNSKRTQQISSVMQTAHIGGQRLKRQHGERWGYIGANTGRNLGDDAMFAALEALWRAEWPARRLLPVELPWHERRLSKIALAGEHFFEGALLGGGTLIGPFWESQVRTLLRQNVPLWSLGTGAGSCGFVQNPHIELGSWSPLLREFRGIGVRGPLSRDKLQSIGVEARVIGDLALLLAHEQPFEAAPRPRVALNLALPTQREESHDEERKLREVEEVLREWKALDFEIVAFAMNPVDIAPTRAALERAGIEAQVPLLQSAQEFWELVGPCRCLVAVRLHAAILASCVGVPTLMLGYRDKCLDFMASMEQEKWHVDLLETAPGIILETARQLAKEAPSLRLPLLKRAHHWQEELRKFSRALTT